MTTVREIKRNLDGRVLQFECELLYRDAGRAVLHYVSPTSYEFAGVRLEAGCHTTALYRVGQPYVLWRITAPDGTLRGHYLHLADNVRIEDDRVTWDDLAVDVWVWPDGRYAVWDEDELRAFHERGLVSAEKVAAIERVKREVVGRIEEVVLVALRPGRTPWWDHQGDHGDGGNDWPRMAHIRSPLTFHFTPTCTATVPSISRR